VYEIKNNVYLCINKSKGGGNSVNTAKIKMTTSNNSFADTTIVAFHIGRGGRFYNSGHVSFLGQEKIGRYVHDLFAGFENEGDILRKIGDRDNLRRLFDEATSDNATAKAEFERRTGLDFGEETYRDNNGNNLITVAQVETGIGRIEEDGDYDTTYCKYLSDCTEGELELIVNYTGYVDSDIVDYAQQYLNS
jgi:hypothetical protein